VRGNVQKLVEFTSKVENIPAPMPACCGRVGTEFRAKADCPAAESAVTTPVG
jgi:hypothetical protein